MDSGVEYIGNSNCQRLRDIVSKMSHMESTSTAELPSTDKTGQRIRLKQSEQRNGDNREKSYIKTRSDGPSKGVKRVSPSVT